MKNTLLSNLIPNPLLIAITSILLVTGCTKQETIDDTIILNDSASSFATPISGNIYTIKNVGSERTLDIENESNSNGANLQVWGKDANTTSTNRQWEVIDTDNGYVRLKGVDSGKSLEVFEGSNSNGANVEQRSYQGLTHQQWKIISVGNGNFRLKNRDSGKSLRARNAINGSNVDQAAYHGASNQQWFFTQVESNESSITEEEETTISTPTITETEGNDEGETLNNDFITTNDGVFNLDDFQIESSSHLSSSTSTTTTSWSYDESDIFGTEWYNIIDDDYYLKSAEIDGKRTEFKERPGQERSLISDKTLKYEASIDNIPENGVTIAQVHNRGGVRRPYLRVYIEDGRIEVKETTNALTNSSGTYNTVNGPTYSENSKIKIQITTTNGTVNIKVETTNGTLDEDFTPDGDDDYKDDYYLKAGVYTEGNDTEPIIRFYSFEDL